MDIQEKDGYLNIEVNEPVCIDNDYVDDFSGCRIKVEIDVLKTIRASLDVLAAGGLCFADIVTGRPEIVFLVEDEDAGELVEMDYAHGEGEVEPVINRALEFRLNMNGDGLFVSVIAYPKWSDGRFYSVLGTIPNEAFGWIESKN